MSLRLERLVYESTATGSTAAIGNLAVILAESQRNNDRDGLTGALAAHRDRYFQVVEGSASALDALLRRLENDPRHRDVTLLGRERVPARMFGRWSMTSARITPALGEALDRLVDDNDLTPGRVIRVLMGALNTVPTESAGGVGNSLVAG